MEAGVEPLWGVGGGALGGEHVAHLCVVAEGVGLGGEVAAFPAPVCPAAREAVEDLAGVGLTDEALVLGQVGEGLFVGD